MRLPASLRDEILAHATANLPFEACGILAGPPGGEPVRHLPMRNIAASPVRYAVDPVEQLAIYDQLDERGEDPLVIWHSHPAGFCYPSATDVDAARDPNALYLIVSPRTGEMRCWRIVGGHVTEEPVEVSGGHGG